MNNKLCFSFIFGLLLIFHAVMQVSPATGQDETTDDKDSTPQSTVDAKASEVIERYIEAKGGRDGLKQIKNFEMRGTVKTDGVEFQIKIYQAANRHLSIYQFPNGTSVSSGTNGKIAWHIDVDGNPNILTGRAAREYISHYSSLHESLEWKKQSKLIKYVGEKTMDMRRVHHLIFVLPDDRQVNRYFSVDSGLFYGEEQISGEKDPVLITSRFREYKKGFQETLVARRRINHINADIRIEYQIDSISANSVDEDKVFALPKVVRELIEQSDQPKQK